jgi:diacylglycerol kinase family enzyme
MSESSTGTNRPLLIVNARASRVADPTRLAQIVKAAAAAVEHRFGVSPQIEQGTVESTRAALAVDPEPPLVVVVGGDGTVREAAAALLGREASIAIVPAGTGNVLASALGIRGIRASLDVIRSGQPRRLDLGRARWREVDADRTGEAVLQERLFTAACGMGLDARVMAAAEHEWKRRLKFGAYVGAAVREFTRLTPATFRIVADGEAIEIVGHLVLVANAGELVPGRIGPREPIDPTDGRLELIVLGGASPFEALHGAAALMLRTGELSGGVIRRSIREVTIGSEPLQPIEIDGDHHPPTDLEVSVVPGAVSVLVPG